MAEVFLLVLQWNIYYLYNYKLIILSDYIFNSNLGFACGRHANLLTTDTRLLPTPTLVTI
jgi:hypothetical protein